MREKENIWIQCVHVVDMVDTDRVDIVVQAQGEHARVAKLKGNSNVEQVLCLGQGGEVSPARLRARMS